MSDRIADKYEIVRCLGVGSMATVYLCRSSVPGGMLFALKLLFPNIAKDEIACGRLRDEFTASLAASHPNVVKVLEYLRNGDFVGFSMEYVDGGDLASKLDGTPMELRRAVQILSEIAAGLAAIHSVGIVHRDLKPENILLTKDGRVKIADFGAARSHADPNSSVGVVGCLDYVPPEFLERGQIDFRSDVYAMGLLAYEMITGQLPFEGSSVIQIMTNRLSGEFLHPIELNRRCPPRLNALVVRAMEREPTNRFASAEEFRSELLEAALEIQDD